MNANLLDLRNDSALMTTAKAARVYGLSEQTIRNLVKRGELAGIRVGREFRVYADQPDWLLNPSRRGPHPTTDRIR